MTTLGRLSNNPRHVQKYEYLTTCKNCLTGIYKGRHTYTWQKGPVPGFVHEYCAPGFGVGGVSS